MDGKEEAVRVDAEARCACVSVGQRQEAQMRVEERAAKKVGARAAASSLEMQSVLARESGRWSRAESQPALEECWALSCSLSSANQS